MVCQKGYPGRVEFEFFPLESAPLCSELAAPSSSTTATTPKWIISLLVNVGQKIHDCPQDTPHKCRQPKTKPTPLGMFLYHPLIVMVEIVSHGGYHMILQDKLT